MLARPWHVEMLVAAFVEGNEEMGTEVAEVQWKLRLGHLFLKPYPVVRDRVRHVSVLTCVAIILGGL